MSGEEMVLLLIVVFVLLAGNLVFGFLIGRMKVSLLATKHLDDQ
jgi:hypothetical protein